MPTCVRALRCAGIMCHSTYACRLNVSERSRCATLCVRAPRCTHIMCHSTQICRNVSEHSDVPASFVIVLRYADIMCHSTLMYRHYVSYYPYVPSCVRTVTMCQLYVSKHSGVSASCVIVPRCADRKCQSTQMCRRHVS